jgi:hypothetical protein
MFDSLRCLACSSRRRWTTVQWRKQIRKHPFRIATFFLCILMLAFAPGAWAQEQTNPGPQAGAKPAKEQLKPEEPEANTSASTEALQKATQNPVASLISVPIQNNNNFGMNPGYRTQDVLNIQPVIPIGISKNWNLLVRWIMPIVWQPLPNQPSTPETGVYGLGDMVPTFFISPKNPGKLIWGAGPVFQLPTATHLSGTGQTGNRAIHRCADATGPLDFGCPGKQCLVGGGFGQSPGCESVPAAILHQLQPQKGLVHHLAADPYCKLGSCQWESVDRSLRRRNRTNHETWFPARVPHSTVLRQRRASDEYPVMDYAFANCISVSQVD